VTVWELGPEASRRIHRLSREADPVLSPWSHLAAVPSGWQYGRLGHAQEQARVDSQAHLQTRPIR